MQADLDTHGTNGGEPAYSGHSLLLYEINRLKNHITIHGSSSALQERLERLESLVQPSL